MPRSLPRRIACLLLAVVLPVTLAAIAPQTAVAERGIVVAGHPEAAAAGVAVLQEGGTVVDAAVAVSLVLGVVEPYGSGLGGKLLLLHHDAGSGVTHAVEALDAAPLALDPAAWRARPALERNLGIHSIAVPGLPAGLLLAHERWGRLPFARLAEPAIRLAREGFAVLPGAVRFFRSQERKLQSEPEIARLYLSDGAVPRAGDRLVNEDLARTLEALALRGHDGFYRGPVAEAIVAESRRRGGALSLEDFAAYRAHARPPLRVDYRGFAVETSPPPATGGAVTALTLAVLGEAANQGPQRTPDAIEPILRAFGAANRAVRAQLGDTPDAADRWARLVAPESVAVLRREAGFIPNQIPQAASLGLGRSFSRHPPLGEPAFCQESRCDPLEREACTTHFVVADAAGNVVCATQSQSLHFGSAIVAPGTGVILNNSLSNFTTADGDSPNAPAPGRRPRTTISPAIVLRDGRPLIALGLPGGGRIPSGMVQVLVDRLALDTGLADAIAAPRWHVGLGARDLEFEAGTDPALLEALRARGWRIAQPDEAEHFGGVNAVEFLPGGTLLGVADQRRTNAAAGW